jgi:hypothetical protein
VTSTSGGVDAIEQKLRRRLKEGSPEFQSELERLRASREKKRLSRIARDAEKRSSKVEEPTPMKESALFSQSVDNSVPVTVEGNRPSYLLITDTAGKDFSVASSAFNFRGRWEQAREVMHSATSVENDFYSGAYFFGSIRCNLFQVTVQNLSVVYGTGRGCLRDSFFLSVREFFGLPGDFSFAAVFVLAGKEDAVRVCDPGCRAQLDSKFPELSVNALASFTFHQFYMALWHGLIAVQRDFNCPLFYLGFGPMTSATPAVEPVWTESMGRNRVDCHSAEELHYYCSRVIDGVFLYHGDLPRISLPIFCPLPRYTDAIFRGGSTLLPRAVFMLVRDIHNCFVRCVNLTRHLRDRLEFFCCIGKPALKSPDGSVSHAVAPSADHNHGDRPCTTPTAFNSHFTEDIRNHLTIQV